MTATIWTITDGKAGNEAMAIGLAEAVARRVPAVLDAKRIAPRAGLSRLPASAWAAMPQAMGWPFSGLAGPERLEGAPDLVIGAGGRIAAPFTAALRGRGAKTVEILDWGIAPARFDLVVAPEHDRLSGPNVVSTLGSVHRATPERVAEAAAAWRDRLEQAAGDAPGPRIALLIGGDSRSHRLDAAALDGVLRGVDGMLSSGCAVLATASRRTGGAARAALAKALARPGGWLWDGEGENPYFGLLGQADAIVATEDLVNMASEAASVGKPLYIAALSGGSEKLARFHQALRDRGLARPFAPPLEFDWAPEPLNETERAAERVAALLAPAALSA